MKPPKTEIIGGRIILGQQVFRLGQTARRVCDVQQRRRVHTAARRFCVLTGEGTGKTTTDCFPFIAARRDVATNRASGESMWYLHIWC